MSEFREDLLASTLDKKRLIKILVVAVALLLAFAFSTVVLSLFWNSLRPPPNDRLSEAEREDVILILPPFPYNLSDFNFPDMPLDQLSQLLDAFQDMFDGDIDDLDLGNYSQMLGALMASEREVFRVYGYSDFSEMSSKLWRYESFDEYTGDGWQSTAITYDLDYYTYNDYFDSHWDKEIYHIKLINLTTNIDNNSMVIPSFFPTPFIMEGSVFARPDNLRGTPQLIRDDFNCTVMRFNADTVEDINMTYELFGLDNPTSAQIIAVATDPSDTPNITKNEYLKAKGAPIADYINDPFNNDFNYHLNQINNTIYATDNTYEILIKIQNYLNNPMNFQKVTDPAMYNPAPDGYDSVEYFCETRLGYWSDFASAFCVFARAFGVPSRFVDGFNSFWIQEIDDPDGGSNTFAIKYKNIYNWAEVFIPTGLNDGFWVQMDIYYNNPLSYENFQLDATSDFTAGYRPDIADITATLTLNGTPVEGRQINFYDLTSSQFIGQGITDLDGNASVIINIDDTQVVGPHYIFAQYNPLVNDTTHFTIYGDIQVNLQNINPQEVNITVDTFTDIQGYVVDPVNNQRVNGTMLELVLFQKGTNIRVGSPPFDYPWTDSYLNGDFYAGRNVDSSVPVGEYELRVDFNGSWWGMSPTPISDSSNRMDFNVTQGINKTIWFYINDIPSSLPESPVVNRFSTLTLKAIVLNDTNYPLENQNVDFYDFTKGMWIGSDTTDINGTTTISYLVDNSLTAGPNILYAKIGIKENYSSFILNGNPTINLLSGPTPMEVNRTGIGASNTIFNIEGEIYDSFNNPIRYSILTLKLLRGGMDYSPYLMPSDIIWTDYFGFFNLGFELASNTPTGNYTLRVDFNGTVDYTWLAEYSTFFNLPYINTSSTFFYDLKVATSDPLLFNFWINGTTWYDYNQPLIFQNGDVDLSVYIEWGSSPIGDGEWVTFYDVTQNVLIGSVQTLNGSAGIVYSTNFLTVAGPHQIYAEWDSNYNYSYFIYDAPIMIDLESGPIPREIMRSGSAQRTFNLHGYLNDSTNGLPIQFAYVSIYLYDGPTDVSYYLSLDIGSPWLDATGEFDLTYSVSSSTPAKNYTLRIEFWGNFFYSWPYNINNEHNFFLGGYINFTDILILPHQLKVIDPENLNIYLSVEGNPTLPFYNNTNSPETYNFGETSHIQVQIIHPLTKIGNTVYLYDDFTNSLISSYIFPDESGFVQFNVSTDSLHAGLIRLRVNYESYSAFNTTYIIINETFSISINSDMNAIQRNFNTFDVWGLLYQNGTGLDGLTVGLLLLDYTLSDASGNLTINGPQFRTVSSGSYFYDDSSIILNCPQGQYYLLIYFTGVIDEAGIYLTDYMTPAWNLIPINITAGTNLSGNYDTKIVKDQFYENDELYVYGYLTWDNGTSMGFMEVNVTIRDDIGNIIATAIGYTDGSGYYNITLIVGVWPDNAEVWVSFSPEDNFSDPEYYYVEFTEVELYREP